MKLILIVIFTLSGEWETFTNCDLIHDIKEREGTLYLATNGGVVLFNPISKETQKIYTNIDGLPSVVTKAVNFDSQGNLWVATEGGMVYLLSGEDYFYIYPRERLPLLEIEDILIHDNNIYIASHSGLARISTNRTSNPDDDNILIITKTTYPALLSDTIYSLFLFNDTLFVGTEKGINLIPIETFPIPESWDSITVSDGLPSSSVHSLLVTDSSFIAGTALGLFWRERDTVKTFLTDIAFLVEDLTFRDDILYVAGKPENDYVSGIWKIEFNGEPVPLFSSFSEFENYWKSKGEAVYVDSENRIWAGFDYAYAGRNPPEYTGIGLLEFLDGDYAVYTLGSLRSNFITSMTYWNGGIWMCSYIMRSIPHPVWGIRDGEYLTIDDPYALKKIYYLKAGPEGYLWACAYCPVYGGVYVIDTNLQIVAHYNSDNLPYTTSIAFTKDGDVIVGVLSKGVFKFPRDNPQDLTLLDASLLTYTFIEIDYRERIWIGSENSGCLIIDEKTGEKINLTTDNGLPENFISTLKPDGETMWIGTVGGLVEYKDDRIQRIFFKDDPVYGTQGIKDVETSPDGNLWILTKEGLFILNPETKEILDYFNLSNSPLVSLPDNFWNRNSMEIIPERGELWIGTVHGVSLFKPDLYWTKPKGQTNYVYPNPLVKKSGDERIYIANVSEDTEVEFYTISGEKLKKESLDLGRRGNVLSIRVENLRPGLYLVTIKKGKKTKVLKFSIVE